VGTRKEQLLTRGELALVIAAVLPIFFFFGGPIWQHAFRIDSSIGWSYAPIPLLVAGLLLRRRAMSWGGFLVSTIIAISVKYMITTTIAVAFWTIGDPPPRAATILEKPNPAARRVTPEGASVLELVQDERGFAPPVLIVRKDQLLAVRSGDGSLHTMRGRGEDGSIVFNYPAVSTTRPLPFSIARTGKIDISCTVHERESHGTLIVIE
jgi:hypothetical protein